MKFKPGDKKPSNSGRKPGQRNKVNQDVRSHILEVASELDLKKYARENPGDFFKFMYAKLIPKDVNIKIQAWVRTLSDEELDKQIGRLSAELEKLKGQ